MPFCARNENTTSPEEHQPRDGAKPGSWWLASARLDLVVLVVAGVGTGPTAWCPWWLGIGPGSTSWCPWWLGIGPARPDRVVLVEKYRLPVQYPCKLSPPLPVACSGRSAF